MRVWCLIILLLQGAAVAAQEAPAKRPWEWTIDERLAARFDVKGKMERRALSEKRRAEFRARDLADGIPVEPPALFSNPLILTSDSINGAEHPEMLLPHEIFNTYAFFAYGIGDDEFTASIQEEATNRAIEVGLPPDMVAVIGRESFEFVAMLWREYELGELTHAFNPDPEDWKKLRKLREELCPVRADAIRRLRTIYGTCFDRFLYDVAARNVSRKYLGDPEPEELKKIEEGCR